MEELAVNWQDPIFTEIKTAIQTIKKLDNFYGVYSFIRTIGAGTEGKINLFNSKFGLVAIKESPLAIVRINTLKSQLREARILESISHLPHVAKFIDSFVYNMNSDLYHCVVMEYLEGEDVYSVINTIDIKTFYKLALLLTKTVSNLHEMGIVHRDIKPENMMMVHGKFYLIDYGFSHTMTGVNKNQMTTNGTPYYMAPELWYAPAAFSCLYGLYNSEIMKAADVWAIGVTLFEILEKKIPWISSTQAQLRVEVNRFDGNFSFTCEDSELIRVIKHMVAREPENRLTAAQAYNSFKMLYNEKYN